jgi:hypothetical protein
MEAWLIVPTGHTERWVGYRNTSKEYSERLVRDVMSIDVQVGAACVEYVSASRW